MNPLSEFANQQKLNQTFNPSCRGKQFCFVQSPFSRRSSPADLVESIACMPARWRSPEHAAINFSYHNERVPFRWRGFQNQKGADMPHQPHKPPGTHCTITSDSAFIVPVCFFQLFRIYPSRAAVSPPRLAKPMHAGATLHQSGCDSVASMKYSVVR